MFRSSITMRRHALHLTALAVAATASSVGAEEVDRTRPPELGPPPSLNLPTLERFELSNGLPVLLLEKHGVPVVQVNLLVRSGTASDLEGKTGLASMTAEMLDEGAGARRPELYPAHQWPDRSAGRGAGVRPQPPQGESRRSGSHGSHHLPPCPAPSRSRSLAHHL